MILTDSKSNGTILANFLLTGHMNEAKFWDIFLLSVIVNKAIRNN